MAKKKAKKAADYDDIIELSAAVGDLKKDIAELRIVQKMDATLHARVAALESRLVERPRRRLFGRIFRLFRWGH